MLQPYRIPDRWKDVPVPEDAPPLDDKDLFGDVGEDLAQLRAACIESAHLLSLKSKATGEPMLQPDKMADAFLQLTEQDRSAWTLELDLRPHREHFFE